ncbi:MAG: hypothetical protein R6V83_02065 [Candidatus Thorarchaeota archaeon]
MSDDLPQKNILRAIKKCLSDTYAHFQEAMDILDEIGRGSLGASVTPIVGGYAMKDPKERYRKALIEVDAGEKSLQPLAKRFHEGIVNSTHFEDETALVLLKDIVDYDYDILIRKLAERRSRESVWYRLDEMSKKIRQLFEEVSDQ